MLWCVFFFFVCCYCIRSEASLKRASQRQQYYMITKREYPVCFLPVISMTLFKLWKIYKFSFCFIDS